MLRSIYIGFDPREAAAFAVARNSTLRHLKGGRSVAVRGLVLSDLIEKGLYTRPIEMRPSAADRPIMWDVISEAPMSTQHANARFLVPELARMEARTEFKPLSGVSRSVDRPAGWALFMDGDMLVRGNLLDVAKDLDPTKAVYCVHHNHTPSSTTKMDGQVQTRYSRKNWTSLILFNVDHPANKSLTIDMVNRLPGRDLHRLCWLADDEIGEISAEWNFLVGHMDDQTINPKVVHFTDGTPDMLGYQNCDYAEDWREELRLWAA